MSHAGITGVSDEKRRHGAPPVLGRPGATLLRSPATAATAASSPSAYGVEIGTPRERSQQRRSAAVVPLGIVFRDIVAVCAPCAARAEQLVAARTANSPRWHGMPRAIAVDAVLRELATGSTSID